MTITPPPPSPPTSPPGGGNNGGSNSPPAITNPGNKQYTQRETITAFGITVNDSDGDTVTVGVSDLPTGLTYSSTTGMVSGTVGATVAAQAHTVTVTADDGVNDPVTETFTITVTANAAPQISAPTVPTPTACGFCDSGGDRGVAITAFDITVSDAENDALTVSVSGLPTGLTYSLTTGQVSGTVSATAPVQLYPVTVTANDGIGDVTRDFNFRVYHRILISAGNVIRSPYGPDGTASTVSEAAAQMNARSAFNSGPPSGWTSAQSNTTTNTLATAAATSACSGMTPSLQFLSGSAFVGSFTWEYSADKAASATEWQFAARRRHPWAARCR